MAGMCCRVVGETETTAPVEPTSKRLRMEIHQLTFVASDVVDGGRKRLKPVAVVPVSSPARESENAVESCSTEETRRNDARSEARNVNVLPSPSSAVEDWRKRVQEIPKFGVTSVCGRRRDMEDAVAVHPCFCEGHSEVSDGLHFFGVYDGHGCSHVAMKCKDRMHEVVKNEFVNQAQASQASWHDTMQTSFLLMDKQVTDWCIDAEVPSSSCRCELRTPQCDTVGSTAVVAVLTPDKIVVSNCGDSRAVLCRNGVAIPLSCDHKPDRADELIRIEEAGGRVIYWDGPRVLGVLAMSRAIGDNYLKPYVIPEPEVTITDRTEEDECLILASDGLWDVVSNDTACSVARMCLQARKPPSPPLSPGNEVRITGAGDSSDKACSDASILLAKLALARHSADNVSVVVVDLRRERL